MVSQRKFFGILIDLRHTLIAGIALVHQPTLATRNKYHFHDLGLPMSNPFRV